MKLVSRRKSSNPASPKHLHQVDESVKAAFMGPRNITLPTHANARAVIWVVGLTCLAEVVLTLAEAAGLGGLALRRTFLLHGAFWNGLLAGWEPMYPFQREAMFVTYALLHGGLLHLIGNMVAVLALGGIAVARIGQKGFILLYAISAIGGGVGFALLSNSETPMVGASGAVFGLIGAWKFWEWQMRQHLGSPMRPLWQFILGLVLLNLVLWLALSGLLAWEAHLGGFVAGVLFAAIVTPSLRYRV
ncbi:rhomboid family intramembrane serine protease [Roseinatronobacter monicus]|uniref:rhomboid family intramembrane serine protease n=1 Tax=Roseinatronobacter monicus TaxID=393481 RepID=UPI003F666A84